MSQTLTSGFSPVKIEERRNLGVTSGDTVRVHQKIQEKGKTRLQVFEGLVLSVKHGTEPGATFTVRKIASGVGVERIFPLYSPLIDKIEITKRAKTRRSKLYYIREKVAREIRRQMRGARFMDLSTTSEAEEAARLEKEEAERAEAEAKAAEEAAAKEAAEAAAKAEAEAQAAAEEAETPAESAEEAPAEETQEEEATEATEEK